MEYAYNLKTTLCPTSSVVILTAANSWLSPCMRLPLKHAALPRCVWGKGKGFGSSPVYLWQLDLESSSQKETGPLCHVGWGHGLPVHGTPNGMMRYSGTCPMAMPFNTNELKIIGPLECWPLYAPRDPKILMGVVVEIHMGHMGLFRLPVRRFLFIALGKAELRIDCSILTG